MFRPFDTGGAFQIATDVAGVRRRAVRGAGATMLSQAGGLAVQIIATAYLARLLVPADFGLVTMVTTFSLLLANFGTNGFTEAVLNCDELDSSLASNLFWINLGAGLLLTIGFAAAGSLLARFYGEPRVAQVAVVVSLTILITSASVLHLALLMRAMRFSQVSAMTSSVVCPRWLSRSSSRGQDGATGRWSEALSRSRSARPSGPGRCAGGSPVVPERWPRRSRWCGLRSTCTDDSFSITSHETRTISW